MTTGPIGFACHLGFPSIDRPLFDQLVDSPDPVPHIAFAAGAGFAGVLDPFAASRSPADQERVGRAAADHGLAMGSFLYLPFADLARARWALPGAEARAMLLDDVRAAVAVADRLGSTHIAILGLAEPSLAIDAQHQAMTDHLRYAGDIAGTAGKILCVEGVNRQRLPQMLLHGIGPSADMVRAVGHPAVRLVFDTGHAIACGEDLVELLEAHHEWVAAVQIADGAARAEMGGGPTDFGPFLAALHEAGVEGHCELEHRWSVEGSAHVQQNYLDRLQSLTAA